MATQAATSRKIHLDFHTPHWVNSVGQDYDPERLVRTWKAANVNAVTVVFGLCACGNSYYESDVSQVVHSGLQRDLLTPLLPVAKREGIAIYVHFGPGINDRAVVEHPEWAMLRQDGTALDTTDGQWGWVCYNSPFVTDWLWPQLEEFVVRFPEVEGVFVDMVVYPDDTCYCDYCRAKAAARGIDVATRQGRDELTNRTLDEFMAKTRQIVKNANPDMAFTCNCRNFIGGVRDEKLDFLEVEAPITWNSYFYPVFARYVRTLGKPAAGMTTRFPKNWGYFGSLNNETQLKFESASIAATLGSVCIGDQLHPSGKPDSGVYELIGDVFAFVKAREPWTLGAASVPDLAMFADWQRNAGEREVIRGYETLGQKQEALYGAGLALLEGNRHFDVLDELGDFSKYRVLWLPENVTLDEHLAPLVEAFVRKGGRLLVTGNTPWRTQGWREALERMAGVSYGGTGDLTGEFIEPIGKFADGLPQVPYFVRGAFPRWEIAAQDVEIAAKAIRPYEEIGSDRRFGHFHAPAGEEASYPGAVARRYGEGRIMIVAASLAEDYFAIGSRHIRTMLLNFLDALTDPSERPAEVAASAAVEISLMSQPGRWILHLIQYGAIRHRGNTVMEEVPVRRDIPVALRPPAKPSRIYLAPSLEPLDWRWEDGAAKLTVPELHIHQMVVAEFE